MEMQPEAPITDLQEVRRAKAIENSPFGPVRKFGEAMMRDQVVVSDSATDALPNSNFGKMYGFSTNILGHGAAELTDLSDPAQPFYDC